MPKGFVSEETKRFINVEGKIVKKKVYPECFWCYNPLSEDENCCFWHYIFYPNGGPERDGVFHPCYKYEQEILEYLDQGKVDSAKKMICVYKATGLGLTELILMWILFKCATDPFFQQNEDVVIFTGPNIELAKKLIERMKQFANERIEYEDHGMYKIQIGKANIQVYPSNNIDAVRGIPRVSCVFGDEAAFFTGLKDDKQIRTVGERYRGKSDSYVIWVSTAGDFASGFFYEIKEEPDAVCQYKRFEMYEDRGLEKDSVTGTSIFSDGYIEEARKLPSFPQEFQGIWGANVGDIYSTEALDEVTDMDYEIDYELGSKNRLGFCDPGFGSSQFGICITEMRDNMPYVIYSKSYKRQSATAMVREISRLADLFSVHKWGCDKANPEIIKDMRETLHLNVTAISNKESGRKMTVQAATKVQKKKVRIHPKFLNLKKQLMTITFGKNGQPNKTNDNPFDEGDAFQGNLYLRFSGSGHLSIQYDTE
jgi:hypothetical protein